MRSILTCRNMVFAALMALLPQLGHAAVQKQKNCYAYDVTIDKSAPASPKVSYKLSATCSKVEVTLWSGSTKIATVAGGTALSNTVTFSNIITNGTISAKVQAWTKTTVTTPTHISDNKDARNANDVTTGKHKFYCPYSVAINNSTDSPTFGRMLISETVKPSGTSGYYSNASNTHTAAAIYAFDPQFQGILHTNSDGTTRLGFTAGIGGTSNDAEDFSDLYDHRGGQKRVHRLRYSDDGRLFAMGSNYNGGGLWEINPATLNSAFKVFGGTQITATPADYTEAGGEYFTGANGTGTFIGGAGAGLSVWGSGANLKVACVSSKYMPRGYTKRSRVCIYNLGTTYGRAANKAWTSAPTNTGNYDGILKNFQRPDCNQVNFNKSGVGFTASSLVIGISSTNGYSLVHCTSGVANTNKDYDDATSVKHFDGCGAFIFNKDYSLCAYSHIDGIKVATVKWNGNAWPTLTDKYTIIPSGATDQSARAGSKDLAFDYANNLYTVNNRTEIVEGWQIPNSIAGDNQTTPSPSSNNYALNNTQVLNLKAAAATWGTDKHSQTTKLTWTATTGASSYKVYRDGALLTTVTTNSCTAALNLKSYPTNSTAAANTYQVSAVIGTAENTKSNAVTVKAADFGTMTISAKIIDRDNEPDGVITWTKPAYGKVTKYQLYTVSGNTATLYKDNIAATTLTDTIFDIGETAMTFRVRAVMDQIINTTAQSNLWWVQSPNATAISSAQYHRHPVIDYLMTYNGPGSTYLTWHLANTHGLDPVGYEVWRDGQCVVSNITADNLRAIDAGVPSGTLNYTVRALYSDGKTADSAPRSIATETMPSLTFHTVHNDEGTEITALEGSLKWPALSNDGEYGNGNWYVKGADIRLYDDEHTQVASWTINDPACSQYQVKTFDFSINDYHGEPLIENRRYFAHIEPVLGTADGRSATIDGEYAAAFADYQGNIGQPAHVQGYEDVSHQLWRVDIDFDRALLSSYPEPVSRFIIEYRPLGETEWLEVPDLRLMFGGKMYMTRDEARRLGLVYANKHDGYIPGDYLFGNEQQGVTMSTANGQPASDKGYVLVNPEPDAFPVVGYHLTDASPAGNEYRMTAIYGLNNPKITKRYAVTASVSADDLISTGVIDLTNPDACAVRAYPIPVIQTLTVVANTAIEHISVISATGATVADFDGNDDRQQTIDLGHLAAGWYLLRVNDLEPIRIVKK